MSNLTADAEVMNLSEKSDTRPSEPIEVDGDSIAPSTSGDVLSTDASAQLNNKQSCGKRKRRRRRGGAKRKYKPYMKLTWEERRDLEAREEKRAEESRKQRFRHGIPVAPYNTTQFLLEDRQARTEHKRDDSEVEEIVNNVLSHGRHRRKSEDDHNRSREAEDMTSESGESSTSNSSGLEDYLRKEFSVEYSTVHAERLENMTKMDLVRDYLELEKRLEDVQGQLVESRARIAALEQENQDLRTVCNSSQQTAPDQNAQNSPVTGNHRRDLRSQNKTKTTGH